MSNHTHVVLRIDPTRPRDWTDEEVAYRWARLTRLLEPDPPSRVHARMREILEQPERLEELRQRLGSLSWFMRYLHAEQSIPSTEQGPAAVYAAAGPLWLSTGAASTGAARR